MASTNPVASICPTWVVSNNSNVCMAKDREWFTEYIPFKSVTDSRVIPGSAMLVHGVGTVDLPVMLPPDREGMSKESIIHLKNVIHVPEALCNIIGSTIFDDLPGSTISFGLTDYGMGSIVDREGKIRAYFRPNERLFVLQLSSPPHGTEYGRGSLSKGKGYCINVQWAERERQRFAAFMAHASEAQNV